MVQHQAGGVRTAQGSAAWRVQDRRQGLCAQTRGACSPSAFVLLLEAKSALMREAPEQEGGLQGALVPRVCGPAALIAARSGLGPRAPHRLLNGKAPTQCDRQNAEGTLFCADGAATDEMGCEARSEDMSKIKYAGRSPQRASRQQNQRLELQVWGLPGMGSAVRPDL